jgi:O-acetyl-ADP-ribose deacetylase (regulator of RNase III)
MLDVLEYNNAIKFCTTEFVVTYLERNIPPHIRNDVKQLRQYLNDVLTVNKEKMPDNIQEKLDIILQYELSCRILTLSEKIPNINSKWPISLWRGDITTLYIDCIVNAANEKGLGCFIKGHICIDNIIHSRSGPRMREECQQVLQGKEIKPGNLISTKGYNLPCQYVFHVLGPKYRGKEEDKIILGSCYLNCLNQLRNMRKHSIAFCCISTGEYQYPKKEAAMIATLSVKRWLLNNSYLCHVIFCVFTDEDEKYYQMALSQFL